MNEIGSDIENLTVSLIDPGSKKQIGEIALVGEPVPATEWIDSNGPLQGFRIVDGMGALREVWISQTDILLCNDLGHQSIRIVTFPTDGENSGFLDYTSEFTKYPEGTQKSRFKLFPRRGLAFLNSLLGS